MGVLFIGSDVDGYPESFEVNSLAEAIFMAGQVRL